MKMKIVIALVFILFGAWFANDQDLFVPNTQVSVTDEALLRAGDKCANIATNAVSKLPVIVEFQRLEIAGRKARVMRQCMEDNGYQENQRWVEANMAEALKAMKTNSISEYEALENRKRIAMYAFLPIEGAPLYWAKIKPKQTTK